MTYHTECCTNFGKANAAWVEPTDEIGYCECVYCGYAFRFDVEQTEISDVEANEDESN